MQKNSVVPKGTRELLCDPPEGTEMSLSVGADAFCAECSDVTCVMLGWSIPVHASCVLALAGRILTQKPKNSSHEFDTFYYILAHPYLAV